MSSMAVVLIRSKNCLPCGSTKVNPRFFGGAVLLICLVYCVVCLLSSFSVSCVPNVDSVSGLSILDCPPSFFTNIYSLFMLYQVFVYLAKYSLNPGILPKSNCTPIAPSITCLISLENDLPVQPSAPIQLKDFTSFISLTDLSKLIAETGLRISTTTT